MKFESVKSEDTISDVVNEMEKKDQENQEKGLDATMVFSNKTGKSKIMTTPEKIPEPRENITSENDTEEKNE
ncbi:MAG: hypothetical protein KAI71_01385 [Candidatus Pacebacteria bacterium]|nr:hypothetical protein [Candidatus Paceibacterota bacterium]